MGLLTKVKRTNARMWHYVLSKEFRPTCGCGCPSADRRRSTGDALCRCPCHAFGRTRTLSLCEKATTRDCTDMKQAAQLALVSSPPLPKDIKRARWNEIKGRDPGCQLCQAIGARLTRDEVKDRIAPKVTA